MKKGFTLIELMVVMTVIAILATMVLFGLGKAQAAARDVARYQIIKGIQTGLEMYYRDKGEYPYTHGFGTAVNNLISEGYVTAPTDPGANCTAPLGTTDWSPCGSGAYYNYEYTGTCSATGCTGYYMTLTKESGGLIRFDGPN